MQFSVLEERGSRKLFMRECTALFMKIIMKLINYMFSPFLHLHFLLKSLALTQAQSTSPKGSPGRRLFSSAFEGLSGVIGVPVVEDDVFSLKDLYNVVIYKIMAKEYNFLPSTL